MKGTLPWTGDVKLMRGGGGVLGIGVHGEEGPSQEGAGCIELWDWAWACCLLAGKCGTSRVPSGHWILRLRLSLAAREWARWWHQGAPRKQKGEALFGPNLDAFKRVSIWGCVSQAQEAWGFLPVVLGQPEQQFKAKAQECCAVWALR